MSGRRRVEADKRRRTETSCDVCKSRKQKCDRQQSNQPQCRYCKVHDLNCTTTQPRKQRLYGSLEHLGTRIHLLETIAKGLVPEADLSSNDELRRLGTSLGIPLPPDDIAHEPSSEPAITEGLSTIDQALPLLPDQQGQVQYTGPASSFSFHLKLRSLFDDYSAYEFVMFGPNAAVPEGQRSSHAARSGAPAPLFASVKSSQPAGPDERLELPEPAVSNELVEAYFAHAHASFPVLHETSFRATYELWSQVNTDDKTSACWSVTLLCVCLLGRKAGHAQISNKQETSWWQQIQIHLPTVLFTTDIAALQALMLVALHLHHTSHRDACWNLTGAAVRIAYAIGLHSDDTTAQLPPLTRELRKSVWWTLVAFEQLLVSSLDRPSAIDVLQCTVSPPDERILGLMNPPEYAMWSIRLEQLLNSACRARKSYGKVSRKDEALGPLSPVLSALRDLQRWKEVLPAFLQPEATHTTAPCYVRPILLLEVRYHYAIIVLTRAVLLEHATIVSGHSHWSHGEGARILSDECRGSGTAICQALLSMHESGCFDSSTWFDLFYGITGALILVLEIVIMQRQGNGYSGPSSLFQRTAVLAEKCTRNQKMPGTLRKWATLISELSNMTKKFCASQTGDSVCRVSERVRMQQTPAISDARLLMSLQQPQMLQGRPMGPHVSQSGTGGPQQHHNIDPSLWYGSASDMSAGCSFTTTQHEWQWDDIEAILNQ
jgi:hypothetical protein